jgi:hypothetical protein
VLGHEGVVGGEQARGTGQPAGARAHCGPHPD